jgi:hypothetical protein
MGWSSAAIAAAAKHRYGNVSEGQINAWLHKAAIRRSDYRNGTSPFARRMAKENDFLAAEQVRLTATRKWSPFAARNKPYGH